MPDYLIASHPHALVLYDESKQALSVRPVANVHNGPNESLGEPDISDDLNSVTCPTCGHVTFSDVKRIQGPGYFNALNLALLKEQDSPLPTRPATPDIGPDNVHNNADAEAQGYYEKYFIQQSLLGRGSWGVVYLVQHVLHGHSLGLYAVKKIALGRRAAFLKQALQEIKHLENLRHPNIIGYHHSWLEYESLTSFGPGSMVLNLLMQYANGGSLAQAILVRKGFRLDGKDVKTWSDQTKSERIRAFKSKKTSQSLDQGHVHYFNNTEISAWLEDILKGLEFLHSRNILHYDLKSANCLLHQQDDQSMPICLLSDFGSAQSVLDLRKDGRTGHTGTLEYIAPELLRKKDGSFEAATKACDMWSLGVILYEMISLNLPYDSTTVDGLSREIMEYEFDAKRRRQMQKEHCTMPFHFSTLLSNLLTQDKRARPDCQHIIKDLRNVVDVQSSRQELVQVSPTRSMYFPASKFETRQLINLSNPALQLLILNSLKLLFATGLNKPWFYLFLSMLNFYLPTLHATIAITCAQISLVLYDMYGPSVHISEMLNL